MLLLDLGRKQMPMKVSAKVLERALIFIEDFVKSHERFEPSFEGGLLERGAALPTDILGEIIGAVRNLFVRPRPRPGKFIVVTGIDRTGKETHCFNPRGRKGVTSLYDFLKGRSYKVLRVYQPSYATTLGSLVSAYLLREDGGTLLEGELSKEYAWILWSLDRAQHNDAVIRWLQGGTRNIVLGKRWAESNIVYQVANSIDKARVLNLERNIVKQDYTVVLDMPAKMALERLRRSKDRRDLYEYEALSEEIRQLYLNLPEHYPYGEILVLDASRPLREVNAEILGLLRKLGF